MRTRTNFSKYIGKEEAFSKKSCYILNEIKFIFLFLFLRSWLVVISVTVHTSSMKEYGNGYDIKIQTKILCRVIFLSSLSFLSLLDSIFDTIHLSISVYVLFLYLYIWMTECTLTSGNTYFSIMVRRYKGIEVVSVRTISHQKL